MLVAVPEISGADHFTPLEAGLGGECLERDVSDVRAASHTAGVDGIPLVFRGEKGGIGINIAGDRTAGELCNFVCKDLHSFAVPVGARAFAVKIRLTFGSLDASSAKADAPSATTITSARRSARVFFIDFFLL
jgi:hypothetical protein